VSAYQALRNIKNLPDANELYLRIVEARLGRAFFDDSGASSARPFLPRGTAPALGASAARSASS
jgi:hypothetical protein